jgi:2-(1,2-epoxy-1,2-dihydrophenyl)acetyl-CoA isomerase
LEIALNRPDVYNALNMEMMVLLGETLSSAAVDDTVKGVIITGKGKAFCSGGDLRSISQQSENASSVLYRLAPQFHLSIVEIHRMKKPVIAALNGIAAGGGFSLALACDFRLMGESGVLRQAYTSSGLSMDGGGSFALPRLVGMARAMEILAFDEPIPAAKALAWGLVTKVVPDEQVLPESIAMLESLTSRSLHSFAWAKKLMTDSLNNPLESQLELERQGISACATHSDGQEGIRAFIEKRKPDFSGHKNS